MRCVYAFILLLFINTGCKQRIISGAELQDKLIETMSDHLRKTMQPGTTFIVKDVAFYPVADTKSYLCQFHVKIHSANKDTTGIMAATITNDFTKVTRTQ